MEFYSVVRDVAIVACFLFLCATGRKIYLFGRFLYLTCKIPGPTLWELVTVHAKQMLGDGMVTYAWKLCESYNYKPWGTWMANGTYVIVVSDCETINTVYKSNSTTDKSDLFYKQVAQFVGRNIFSMNGPDYAQYRKMFGSGLRKSLQDFFLPRMHQPMSKFVEALHEKSAESDVDLRSLVEWHMMASTIVSFTSASHDNASHNLQLSSDCLPRRMEIIQTQAMNPVYYWFLRLKTSTRQNKKLCETGFGALDEILMNEKSRALCTGDSDDARDILQVFIQSYLKLALDEGSDKVLYAQGRQLFIASVETTAFVVNILLLLLALHQDIQQRVCDEVDSVLGKDERPILVDDLEKMEYMEMVIKEALRLFPAGPMLARSVREETQFNDGTLAPAGSTIVINALALQRNPEYFRDPLKFDPNRFLPEASKDIRPYSYIPFSAGYRNCPGQAHAFAMVKLFLCYVVKNFRILPGAKLKSLDDIKIKLCVTLHLQESSLRLVDRHSGKG